MNSSTNLHFNDATTQLIQETESLLIMAKNNQFKKPALEESAQEIAAKADIVKHMLHKLLHTSHLDQIKNLIDQVELANKELNGAIYNYLFLESYLSDGNEYIKILHKATTQAIPKLEQIKMTLEPHVIIDSLSNHRLAEKAFWELVNSTDEQVKSINNILHEHFSLVGAGESFSQKYENLFLNKDFCSNYPKLSFEPQTINQTAYSFLKTTQSQFDWLNSVYFWGIGGILIGRYILAPATRTLARTGITAAHTITSLIYSGLGMFQKRSYPPVKVDDKDLESSLLLKPAA
jgi:hypothetical protein